MTYRNSNESWHLGVVPQFAICPSPRCAHREDLAAPTWCGRPATCQVAGVDWLAVPFRCADHAGRGGLALVTPHIMRRVRMSVDVFLCGVAATAPACQTEALARLEQAVAAIGGLLDVERVTSSFGRCGPMPASGGHLAPADGAD